MKREFAFLNKFSICDPVQQKGHLVGQVNSEIMNKNNVQNRKKIKGNTHFVNGVLSKISLSIFTNLVSFENLLNLLLDYKKISIFSKVDKMYLLLYWVTFVQWQACTVKTRTNSY